MEIIDRLLNINRAREDAQAVKVELDKAVIIAQVEGIPIINLKYIYEKYYVNVNSDLISFNLFRILFSK